MSQQTADATVEESSVERGSWKGAVLGGIAGALVFGAMMAMGEMAAVLEMAIPAMYGIQGPAPAIGMTIHVVHGAVLGLGFAGLAGRIEDVSTAKSLGLGVVYGAVVWAILAVLVMPVWLQAVAFAGAPPVPNVNLQSLVGHVVYGLVVGIVYAAYRRR